MKPVVGVVDAMNDVYGHSARAARDWRFLSQGLRGGLADGRVGVVGDLGQHVLEVVEGSDAPVAAGLDDGEEDGATLAAIGVADEPKTVFES